MKNAKHNKKKLCIIILSVLFLIAGGYCGTWYYYYHQVAMAHFPDASYGFALEDVDGAPEISTTRYVMTDEKFDCFRFDVPKFGNFSCSFGFTTSIGYDDDHVIRNEDGRTEYSFYTMSGSQFSYSGGGRFLLNGKINCFVFNVENFSENASYPRATSLQFDYDGNLTNRDDLSSDEYALYQAANPEIQEYIAKMKMIYDF